MKLVITYENISKEQSMAIRRAINMLENNGAIEVDDSPSFKEE